GGVPPYVPEEVRLSVRSDDELPIRELPEHLIPPRIPERRVLRHPAVQSRDSEQGPPPAGCDVAPRGPVPRKGPDPRASAEGPHRSRFVRRRRPAREARCRLPC